MRFTKFRAWDKVNGAMIDVHKLGMEDGGYVYTRDGAVNEDYRKIGSGDIELMQFTGRRVNENGQEIYVGDIMRNPAIGNYVPEMIGVVVFVNKFSAFMVRHSGKGTMLGTTHEELNRWAERGEIIGNIYENPDMLQTG